MSNSTDSPRLRVLSGMRPTGKLHLGHWVGALSNWVKLQDQYDCFYFIADWHALTTDYADTSGIKKSIVDIAIDWLQGLILIEARCLCSRMSRSMLSCTYCFP